MESATVDASQFPILMIRVHPVHPTSVEVDQMFADLEQVMATTEGKYVAITVAPTQFISSEARVRLGTLSKSFYERYQDREIISILVSTSPIARIMLQTIQLLFRPYSQKQVIVGSIEEAMDLAEEKLQAVRSTS